MPRPSTTLYPNTARELIALGQRLKMARLRRRFSAETVATRAGIARNTLVKIEAGNSSVTIGNYFQVLVVLGLDKDMALIAMDDVLGRRLQDAELPQRQRAPTAPTRVVVKTTSESKVTKIQADDNKD